MRLDAERVQRRSDGIGYDPSNGNDAAFACALGTERIDRRGMRTHHLRTDARKIACGGHEIVGQRPGEQLTLLVVNQMLEERATQTLYHRTNDLPRTVSGLMTLPQSSTAM